MFHDKKYNYLSKVEIESLTKKVISVDLCKERIDYEQDLINDLMTSLDIQYIATEWNGFNLKVYYKAQHTTDCTRNDLMEYLPELDYSKGDDLGETEDLWKESTTHDPKANGYDPDWSDWGGGCCDSF